jgi:hypothetical protein
MRVLTVAGLQSPLQERDACASSSVAVRNRRPEGRPSGASGSRRSSHMPMRERDRDGEMP